MQARIGRYIDPLSDYGFKRLLGSEPGKDLLIDFLNELFAGQRRIADLVYNKNEHQGEDNSIGKAVFDLLCTDEQGNRFLIEIQRGGQKFFKDRCLYYTSRFISEQAPKGGVAGWNYELTAIYLVALMETFTFSDSQSHQVLRRVSLVDRETGNEFYNKLGYIYIQLINFVKNEDELETGLDHWLFILKSLSRLDKIPVFLRKPIFEKLFEIAEVSKLNKEERMDYERSLKIKWDNENVLNFAKEQGLEEGLQKGIQKGLQKGIQKGLQEGIQKGKTEAWKEAEAWMQEERRDLARQMKKAGIPIQQIETFSKLSKEEIEQL